MTSISSSLSSLRYKIIRNLSCPVPFLPTWTPIIGGKTLPEMLVTLAMSAIIVAMVLTTRGEGAGTIAEYLGVILIAFALRKGNVLTLFFGISFERAIYWHKVLGCLTLFAMLIHGLTVGETNITGLICGVFLGAAALAYLFAFFEISFNAFYYLHVLIYVAFAPVVYIHGGKWFGLVSIVWGADLLVRYLLQGKHAIGKIKLIGNDVFRIEVPKNNAKIYSGQYCFLMIKKINYYEYHPFTIASSPDSPNLVFYIRSLGDWTTHLRQLYLMAGQNKDDTTKNEHGEGQIELHIEGPYGNVAIDIFNSSVYPVVMMVSGGIGITPMMSMLSHFLHLHATKDANVSGLKKIIFIWVVRDMDLAEALYLDYFEPLLARYAERGENGLHFQRDLKDKVNVHLKDNTQKLELEFHLHLSSPQAKDQSGKLTDPMSWKYGRADCNSIFQEVKEKAGDENTRVGVAVCGPSPMVADIRRKCIDYSAGGCIGGCTSGAKFDLHEELFYF